MIEEARERLDAYNAAERDEAEELYGDYVDAVETGTEILADIRDHLRATLEEGSTSSTSATSTARSRSACPRSRSRSRTADAPGARADRCRARDRPESTPLGGGTPLGHCVDLSA